MEDLIYLDTAYLHYETIDESGIGWKMVSFTRAVKDAITNKRAHYDDWALSELMNIYEIADRVSWRLKQFIHKVFFEEPYGYLELRTKEL